jgi:hypothetical protein
MLMKIMNWLKKISLMIIYQILLHLAAKMSHGRAVFVNLNVANLNLPSFFLSKLLRHGRLRAVAWLQLDESPRCGSVTEDSELLRVE